MNLGMACEGAPRVSNSSGKNSQPVERTPNSCSCACSRLSFCLETSSAVPVVQLASMQLSLRRREMVTSYEDGFPGVYPGDGKGGCTRISAG